MGRAQSDTYSSLFNKSDNVNLDKTFDKKLVFVHVLTYTPIYLYTYAFTYLNTDTDTDTDNSLF